VSAGVSAAGSVLANQRTPTLPAVMATSASLPPSIADAYTNAWSCQLQWLEQDSSKTSLLQGDRPIASPGDAYPLATEALTRFRKPAYNPNNLKNEEDTPKPEGNADRNCGESRRTQGIRRRSSERGWAAPKSDRSNDQER